MTVTSLEELITDKVFNNTNYDKRFYAEESYEVELTVAKFAKLKKTLDQMNDDINSANNMRDYVIEQKFEQPQLIATEYNKLLDTAMRRERCKKKHAKLKHKLRDYRVRYGDF
jgi:predicted transglutaminase-like cysteine proteinase